MFRELGQLSEIAINLIRFARLLALEGRAETAARLLSRSEALYEEIGASMTWWLLETKETTLTTIRTQLDDAALAEEWRQGQALTVDEAVALALDS